MRNTRSGLAMGTVLQEPLWRRICKCRQEGLDAALGEEQDPDHKLCPNGHEPGGREPKRVFWQCYKYLHGTRVRLWSARTPSPPTAFHQIPASLVFFQAMFMSSKPIRSSLAQSPLRSWFHPTSAHWPNVSFGGPCPATVNPTFVTLLRKSTNGVAFCKPPTPPNTNSGFVLAPPRLENGLIFRLSHTRTF